MPLTAPASGTVVTAGDSVLLSATASDSDGSVASVEFFASNGLTNRSLGVVTTPPFAFSWTNVTSGVYTLTAVATDGDGGAGTSNGVSLRVKPLGPDVGGSSGLATPGSKDGGLAWGDFNNDSCLDLAVNTLTSGFLYLQNTASGACLGTFRDVTACLAGGFQTGTGFERSAIWGDIDNDGDIDFARNKSNAIEIYLNNGPGTTACASPPSVAWSRFGVNGAPNRVISAFTFPAPPAFNTEMLAWIDFDEDGDLDLVADNHDNGIVIWRNAGNGTLTDVNPPTIGLPGTASSTGGDYGAVTDYNVDGFVDLLVRKDGTAPDLFRNLGDTFTVAGNIDSGSNGNKGGAAFCDFDSDLDFDLFWTDGGVNQVWRNDGGTFSPTGLPTPGFFTSQAIDDVAGVDRPVRLDDGMDIVGHQLRRNSVRPRSRFPGREQPDAETGRERQSGAVDEDAAQTHVLLPTALRSIAGSTM